MQRKKALSRKTPLKATSKKRPKQTIPDLTKKADKEFSRYIRLRDSVYDGEKWVGECITCERKMVILQDGKWRAGAKLGHFIGRGTKELRYDEFNCNLQCAYDNAWLDKEEMLQRYRSGIIDKYGRETLKELKARAKITRTNKREELEQVIHDSKVEVAHMMEHAENYMV